MIYIMANAKRVYGRSSSRTAEWFTGYCPEIPGCERTSERLRKSAAKTLPKPWRSFWKTVGRTRCEVCQEELERELLVIE